MCGVGASIVALKVAGSDGGFCWFEGGYGY